MKKNKRRSKWLLAAVLTLFVMVLAACQTTNTEPTSTVLPTIAFNQASAGATLPAGETSTSTPDAMATPAVTPTVYMLQGATTTSTGLQYLEESAGSGETPKSGEIITIHYIASLPDGTELANTYTIGEPMSTMWGANRLLPGWEEGVGMMKP